MRALSWNVNGIRAIAKKGFLSWLTKESPDLLAIQETKAQIEQLDQEILKPEGYHTYWSSAEKKGYSGTAIFSKVKPLNVVYGIGLSEFDTEGRTLICEYKDFFFLSCYFPNSQAERNRLNYKIAYCTAIESYLEKLHKTGKSIILCGDMNIAHQAIDLTRPEDNENSPGYYIEEREWMDSFLKKGYTDTYRSLHPEKETYSWWSYRTRARERNIGWRIDYHIIDKASDNRIKSVDILTNIQGSDHCPVELIFS